METPAVLFSQAGPLPGLACADGRVPGSPRLRPAAEGAAR